MFVTNWISTTKIQKISEITNFFRHYFLSRTEVMSGMIMASPEVVTSSTSQGSSSTAMSLWRKPNSYLKRLVAASRHRFRIIKG